MEIYFSYVRGVSYLLVGAHPHVITWGPCQRKKGKQIGQVGLSPNQKPLKKLKIFFFWKNSEKKFEIR